jgi:hypothetical protein
MTPALHKYLALFLVFNGFAIQSTIAQEDFDSSKYRIRFGFTVTKQPDNTRVFKAEFTANNKKDRQDKLPVYGAEILFLNILDDQEVKLGSAETSQDGIAEIVVPAGYTYLTDQEGFMNFRAVFEGNDALDGESEELRIMDLKLGLDLSEVDSVRTITVNALTTDSLGVEIPVSDAFVALSVEGMLSRMPIGEELIEDGELQLEFPSGFPGNAEGNLTVFAVIDDSDTFGNVIQKQTIGWGIPQLERKQESNMLWSEVAPTWMYVVLTILLVGVWANFAYTVFHLFKIKKEGRIVAIDSDGEF